jgi:hypothetical protein
MGQFVEGTTSSMAPTGAPDTSKTGAAIAHSPRTASSCSRASPVAAMSACGEGEKVIDRLGDAYASA